MEKYTHGILVQTIRETEDSFDVEAMLEAEAAHKKRFADMYDKLCGESMDVFALGSGCCTICGECTYPDSPCRFPKRMVSSMEAYGMLVSQICKDNHLAYYYDRNKIAYTGCFLLL